MLAILYREWENGNYSEVGRSNAWFLASRETFELRQETEQMGWSLAQDSEMCDWANYSAELFAPFLPYPGASSHNAMLARQAMPDSGQNFTLCEALIASERRLGP